MSRTIVSECLSMLAADGTPDRKEMGNATVAAASRAESFAFPDDHFRAASAYMECIGNASDRGPLPRVWYWTRRCPRPA